MRALASASVAIVAVALACGEDRPPCYRGDFVGCTCASGARGYQACREAEDGYGACVCDGTTPGVDGGGADAAADSGKRALFEECAESDDCASELCFEYGMGQRRCTKTCSTASECPAPSPGCNNKGVCRP